VDLDSDTLLTGALRGLLITDTTVNGILGLAISLSNDFGRKTACFTNNSVSSA
jgi:hypothetical protein